MNTRLALMPNPVGGPEPTYVWCGLFCPWLPTGFANFCPNEVFVLHHLEDIIYQVIDLRRSRPGPGTAYPESLGLAVPYYSCR